MNNENTAAAVAIESSGPETQDTRIAVRPDWTPEAFRQEVEREKQMRGILQEYMQQAMVKDHHYYSFKEGDKPVLTQEGAHAICSLMKCTFGRPETTETYHDGNDHLTVRARIMAYNKAGDEIATGDGVCSTRESKYAYRWVWDNEIPAGVDKSKLKSKSGQKKGGGTWTQYQLPNQDLPDLYNTVLKMAVKRAKVAAVRQLPLVSELFIVDTEDDEPKQPAKRKVEPQAKSEPREAPASAVQESAVERVTNIAGKLVERGVPLLDLESQFLPEDVKSFADLTEDQAAEIRPAMIELINAKIAGK